MSDLDGDRGGGAPGEDVKVAAIGATAQRSERIGAVRLAAIRSEALSVDEVLAAVADPAAGGHALFVGTVRDVDSGMGVTGLSYSAHPTAVDALRQVAETVASRPGVIAVGATHRVGDLAIGDIAVVVGVSCGHRGEAFDACRALIDELKQTVPIWKHQLFTDGTDEWVGSP